MSWAAWDYFVVELSSGTGVAEHPSSFHWALCWEHAKNVVEKAIHRTYSSRNANKVSGKCFLTFSLDDCVSRVTTVRLICDGCKMWNLILKKRICFHNVNLCFITQTKSVAKQFYLRHCRESRSSSWSTPSIPPVNLSVHPSATLLRCLVCVICNSKSFHSFLFKHCIVIVHMLKMCTSYFVYILWFFSYFLGVLKFDMFSVQNGYSCLVCVICNYNSIHSFIFKLCIMFVHTLKMCTSYFVHI